VLATGLMLVAGPAVAKSPKCLVIDPVKGKKANLTGKLVSKDVPQMTLRLSRPICDAAAPERRISEIRISPTRSATPKHLRNLDGFKTTLAGTLYLEPGVPQPAPPAFVVSLVLVP